MDNQLNTNYNKIATAIAYIQANFRHQPNLDQIAQAVHLSPFHFQRIFTQWAGTSPKKFLQYTTIQYAKTLLLQDKFTLFETAYQAGLSGTSRLHDLFITLQAMTPAEYKNGAKNLTLNYQIYPSTFGNILIASTPKGICYMAFTDTDTNPIQAIQAQYPKAIIQQKSNAMQQKAFEFFAHNSTQNTPINLHLKATNFQLQVWQTLLQIPPGQLTTYGTIASKINNPKAARAVGTAIGNNPVAYLIPCHRVIQATGILGGYKWGTTRKTAIIGWEAAQKDIKFNNQI